MINKTKNKNRIIFIAMLIISLILTSGCEDQTQSDVNARTSPLEQEQVELVQEEEKGIEEVPAGKEVSQQNTSEASDDMLQGYKVIQVDGGDISGYRESNVAVDIGYGNREYWAFTNEYGQLVRVTADEIILQDDSKEPVNPDGRYYSKMADVPGVGADTGYDRGHVIADSLGGVANAYNITPQEATLNRHGNQAYMEKVIRDAGGCTNFEATITYPNTETQIPSHYKYTYTLMGNIIVDEFVNVNPDEYNQSIGLYDNTNADSNKSPSNNGEVDITEQNATEDKYILNTNSKKIHYPNCYSVNNMSEKNKKESTLSRDELISQGYTPCGNCNP